MLVYYFFEFCYVICYLFCEIFLVREDDIFCKIKWKLVLKLVNKGFNEVWRLFIFKEVECEIDWR